MNETAEHWKKKALFCGAVFFSLYTFLQIWNYRIPYFPAINNVVLNYFLSLIFTVFIFHIFKKTNFRKRPKVMPLKLAVNYGGLELSIKVAILILLTTPAQSLLYSLGLTSKYFPSDKLAPFFSCFLLFKGDLSYLKAFINRYRYYLLFVSVLSIFILIRDFQRNFYITADYNLCFSLFSIVTYIVVFSVNKKTTLTALKAALSFQLILGANQLGLYFLGPENMNMFFHNHPSQEGYNFLYRVSGGFLESSQFSSFLALSIIILLKEGVKKNLILIVPALLLFTVSYSLTGYFILGIYVLFNVKRGSLFVLGAILSLPILYYSGYEGQQYVSEIFRKTHKTLNIHPDNLSYPRFSLMFKKLNELFSSNIQILVGSKSSKIMPGGDILSYYTHSLGLVGSTVYYALLSFLLNPIIPSLVICFGLLCITNSPLTSTITQLFIVLSTFFSIELADE